MKIRWETANKNRSWRCAWTPCGSDGPPIYTNDFEIPLRPKRKTFTSFLEIFVLDQLRSELWLKSTYPSWITHVENCSRRENADQFSDFVCHFHQSVVKVHINTVLSHFDMFIPPRSSWNLFGQVRNSCSDYRWYRKCQKFLESRINSSFFTVIFASI